MCTNPDPPWPAWDGSFDYGYEALLERIKKDEERFLSGDSIYLTGGEPTLHPRFLELLKFLAQHFPKQRVKLLTNGRRFFYPEFAQKTLSANHNFEVCVSLHGPDKDTHDSITRTKGSFDQAAQGLTNLITHKQSNQAIAVRFVITRLSYKCPKQFLEFILKNFPAVDRVVLIFWEPEAQAVKNIDKIGVTYTEVVPEINKALPLVNRFKDIRFYHFPLCVIPEAFWPYVWNTLPEHEITFLKKCDDCSARENCLGIQKSYLENIGAGEFKSMVS